MYSLINNINGIEAIQNIHIRTNAVFVSGTFKTSIFSIKQKIKLSHITVEKATIKYDKTNLDNLPLNKTSIAIKTNNTRREDA
jgi:hypothetical protein